MGFGTEIFFFAGLGVLILGPKRLHAMIGHVMRAKAQFEKTAQAFKSQLVQELGGKYPERPNSSLVDRETRIAPDTLSTDLTGQQPEF